MGERGYQASFQMHLGSAFWDPEIQERSAQATIPVPRGGKSPKAKL